jgi:hypothetical protein
MRSTGTVFLDNSFPLQRTRAGTRRRSRIGRLLNRNARLAQFWVSPWVISMAKAFPYFIFHYQINNDRELRAIWEATPVLPGTSSAENPC